MLNDLKFYTKARAERIASYANNPIHTLNESAQKVIMFERRAQIKFYDDMIALLSPKRCTITQTKES